LEAYYAPPALAPTALARISNRLSLCPFVRVKALQIDVSDCLYRNNIERPPLGYRNRGKRPHDAIHDSLASLREVAVAEEG
jgi:hypothetical protein